MRYEDDTFEVMSRWSRCIWIMSNLTWKIINRKTLRRFCKYIIVIFEYVSTTTNALFHWNFQKSLNSTWRLKISQRPLIKIKNGVYVHIYSLIVNVSWPNGKYDFWKIYKNKKIYWNERCIKCVRRLKDLSKKILYPRYHKNMS
jgi:hypothetical protein